MADLEHGPVAQEDLLARARRRSSVWPWIVTTAVLGAEDGVFLIP